MKELDAWKPVVKNNVESQRKWELVYDNVVLATIFHKPTGKFSLWVSAPLVFDEKKRKVQLIGQTYLYKTLDDAKNGFREHFENKVMPWVKAIYAYYSQ